MKTELLLPAGKPESLLAAAANGADAVYLAGNLYGARANAGNFNQEEMKAAVKLCRKAGIRIYVTMNTLVSSDEFSAALDYAKFLYDSGVDALIVQDIGLAGALKKLLPDLRLHGSTQMTIHNVHGAKWAKDFGFQRVILSREMTLEEIQLIHQEVPDLELEVFCHGALCICYSGQCLMSSLIGGRSGNRGQCAQPCRLPYTLQDGFGNSVSGKPSHLLSPRDLNTMDDLKDIIDAGVCSLKIEGRMRRPEYVASVGRVYRNYIDSLQNKEIQHDVSGRRDVEQVFNRNFTPGYLYGNPGIDLMSHEKPNNRGTFLGRVMKSDGRRILIRLENDIKLNDGIEIWVKIGGRLGCTVKEMKVDGKPSVHGKKGQECEIILQGNAKSGDRVFKTFDSALMSSAISSIENYSPDIPISFFVSSFAGFPLKVEATDNLGHSAVNQSSYIPEVALNRPTDEKMIRKQLARLGGSGYCLNSLEIKSDGKSLIPASVLNRFRREIVEELDSQVFSKYPRISSHSFADKKNAVLGIDTTRKKNNIPAISVKVADIYQMRSALEGGADRVYFAPHFGFSFPDDNTWETLGNILRDYEGKVVFTLPQITRDGDNNKLFQQIENALKSGFREFLVGQTNDIAIKERYPEIQTINLDFSANVFNPYTAEELFEMGFDCVTASPELKKEQLERFAKGNGKKEVLVHGAMHMMISRHCVIGACAGKNKSKVPCGLNCRGCAYYLRDRIGMRFPVIGDLYHNCHIFNCHELCLLDELDSLKGFNYWRIEAQFCDIGSLKEIVGLYKTGREQVLFGEEYQRDLLMDELSRYPSSGYTKGHFHRGV